MLKKIKNVISVDIDSDRPDPIRIGKPSLPPKMDSEEFLKAIELDMATLCEGLCTLIRVGEDQGVKSSPESLRYCIKLLEDGMADSSIQARTTVPPTNKPSDNDVN